MLKRMVVAMIAMMSAPAVQAQDVRSVDNVRDARYCELLVAKGPVTSVTVTVYNTLTLNECPPDQWKALDAAKLAKDLGARSVMLNGPRHFLMDWIGQTNAAPPVVTIGGIEFKERATLSVPILTVVLGKAKPYSETTIRRSTEYVFRKGGTIYQLISPSHTYVMQSYAQIVDPALTESGLAGLGSRLRLPRGWTFAAKTLDADLVLKTVAAKVAHIVQDDLQNTYQRLD